MDSKKEIVKIIKSLAGNYSEYQIFSDWVAMMALSIQNGCVLFHDDLWERRNKEYLNTKEKYSNTQFDKFVQMFGLLILALENEVGDVLGEIYMESGSGSKSGGQFFTPFHVSKMVSDLAIGNDVSENHKLTLNEPSCGGGGMIIAAAKVLYQKGINYQKCMEVVAQDVDWKAVYMTYVQLSLLGISATVVQGSTLTEPYIPGEYDEYRVLRTPRKTGVIF